MICLFTSTSTSLMTMLSAFIDRFGMTRLVGIVSQVAYFVFELLRASDDLWDHLALIYLSASYNEKAFLQD